MTSIKILQYNTDNLRHGWDYFARNANEADMLVLQRFPEEKQPDLCEATECRCFIEQSVPPFPLSLVLAKRKNVSTFSGTGTVQLPSSQHVCAVQDQWQGSIAMKTQVSGMNIVNFLPCFPQEGGEFPLSEKENNDDIEFILKQFKDEPTIIIGDFHWDPYYRPLNRLLEKYGYKSYLDGYSTFYKPGSDGKCFNLDKVVSNVDIELDNVSVDTDVEKEEGHLAILYDLKFDLRKDES